MVQDIISHVKTISSVLSLYCEFPVWYLKHSRDITLLLLFNTVYGKTFKGENIHNFRNYAATTKVFLMNSLLVETIIL